MKQTAVEWLQNEIPSIDWENSYWKNRFQQAKEMEKQQIGEAYEDGYSDSDNTFELNKEYYNEQFKKK
jgi:hypothetical protein